MNQLALRSNAVSPSFDSSMDSVVFLAFNTSLTTEPPSAFNSFPCYNLNGLDSRILLLQKEIDALNWTEKLSTTPPRPLRSYPIKQQEANNWINGHKCEKHRDAARKLIQATRHVGQAEFESELKISTVKFNRWLEEQDSQEYVLIVSSQDSKKSNRWVAELALPHLKKLPKEVLSYGLTLDYFKRHPETNKFVFFDDAAYSCSQSRHTISTLNNIDLIKECGQYMNSCTADRQKEILNSEKNHSVIAIIPFMRDPGCILPMLPVSKSSSPNVNVQNHIHVFTSQKIKTIGEILTSKESQDIGCYSEKVPVYFDHKMPDSVSTCTNIFTHGFISDNWEDCEEDLPTQPSSTWEKVVNWFYGVDLAWEARQKQLKKFKEFEAKRQLPTKFIDEIVPPYKTLKG